MLSVKPWRTDAVIFFIAVQGICLFLGAGVVGLLQKAGVNGFKELDDLGSLVLSTMSFQGVTWILMFAFFRYHNVRWQDELGFNKPSLLRPLLLACGTVVVILLVAFPLQQLSIVLMEKVGWKPEDEMAVSLLLNATSRAAGIYLGFFAVVLAPVAEEFIFRGVLFPYIKQLGFPKLAWIGLSLVFALIHGDAAIFIPLFALSLALTYLYEKTDCLLAPIFAHALFNAVNLVLIKFLPQ